MTYATSIYVVLEDSAGKKKEISINYFLKGFCPLYVQQIKLNLHFAEDVYKDLTRRQPQNAKYYAKYKFSHFRHYMSNGAARWIENEFENGILEDGRYIPV